MKDPGGDQAPPARPGKGQRSMKKCIVISDSFKGTLSSSAICAVARQKFEEIFPACQLIALPVADGGEGTVDCFYESCGGEKVTVRVSGPYGERVDAAYLRLDGERAVVEMAAAAGLPMVGERKDPSATTTYGVGELIRHAVEHGSRRIILGLGGSATNDGGCGCAAALGVRFLDAGGQAFVPVGGTLNRIAHINLAGARELLAGVEFTAMCDIDNPMHGPSGAAFVFGPQKGADKWMVAELDRQLCCLDETMVRELGERVADEPGAGAAGAFGAGMMAFFHARLRSGIETVLDTVHFDTLVQGCDAVFTGEGRVDGQSIRGKVISGVARRAAAHGVPVVVVAGGVTEEAEGLCADRDTPVAALAATNRQALSFEEMTRRGLSETFYASTLENVLRLIRLGEELSAARS
jgi:glycerate 2-kinase